MEPVAMAPYNFFVSQRPAVILWESKIQTPADTTISKVFQNTSFMVTKMKVKVRKRMDWTTAFRRTIAPVDDITLRVQPLYESCEWYVGAPQGIEIAPANEFHKFRGPNPSPASIFCKISWFSKFPVHGPGCLVPYNFFASQRPAVILSENEIQTPADKMIWTEFLITTVSISKIHLKDRKRIDCRGRIRGAIAPVDDITLRV